MIHDPTIEVACDRCGNHTSVTLAIGCDVNAQSEISWTLSYRLGWLADGDHHLCEACQEKRP